MTSSRSQTPPAQDSPGETTPLDGPTIPGPGFLPPPPLPPSSTSPDSPPTPGARTITPGDPGAGSSSTGLLAPTRIDIPKGRGKAYAKIAKGVLHAIGGLINSQVQVDELDRSFLPDEDDDATIPPPLGRLAARRVPIGGDGDDFSDLEDIGMAVVGLIAWALKGLTEHLTARKERGPKGRRQPAGTVQYDGTGEAGGEPGASA